MSHRRLRSLAVPILAVCVAAGAVLALRGCHGGQRLVEVFDNGPVGGPPGPSEGYKWVGRDDLPPAGKGWKPVDPDTLTPEQHKRIR